MNNFYVIYNIGCEITGSDTYTNTYEIYDSEPDFLEALDGYIEYAKSCLCDVDEDDEDEINQWFEDCCYNKEDYESYTQLIENKIADPLVENGIYSKGFNCFDVDINIILATTDHMQFIDALFNDFLDRTGIVSISDDDIEEMKDVFEDYPVVKYIVATKKSGMYPSEKAFRSKFRKYEMSINENALSLNV